MQIRSVADDYDENYVHGHREFRKDDNSEWERASHSEWVFAWQVGICHKLTRMWLLDGTVETLDEMKAALTPAEFYETLLDIRSGVKTFA